MAQSEEIFEINDFTVVSELERFVVCIEAVIHEWQLSGKRQKKTFAKGALQRSKWSNRTEPVTFGGVKLKMTHWFIDEPEVEAKEGPETLSHVPALMLDLLDVTGDFSPNSIASFFGLSEYIVVCTANPTEDLITGDDMRSLFLSGITMAVSAAECDVPVLLQYGDPEHLTFAGVCQNRNTRTNFSTVALRNGQPRHTNLAGLLDLFKEKI
uniref:Uncharacterized protein n=1 Tax=Plectus sambesii TaxID=2011161 RepID=A0A914XNS7_9BILA